MVHQLQRAIQGSLHDSTEEVDILHWMSRAALEFVAEGGMGHSFDPLKPGFHTHNPVGDAMEDLV